MFSDDKNPFSSENNKPQDFSNSVALVELSASLVSPGVAVTPRLEDVQDAILRVAKIILSTARGVSQWLRGRKDQVLYLDKLAV